LLAYRIMAQFMSLLPQLSGEIVQFSESDRVEASTSKFWGNMVAPKLFVVIFRFGIRREVAPELAPYLVNNRSLDYSEFFAPDYLFLEL